MRNRGINWITRGELQILYYGIRCIHKHCSTLGSTQKAPKHHLPIRVDTAIFSQRQFATGLIVVA